MCECPDYKEVLNDQYNEYASFEFPAAIAAAWHLLKPSTKEQDHDGIDIVCPYRTIAVRTSKYAKDTFQRFKKTFTIRSKVPSNFPTELDKLLEGKHADVMIKCWKDGPSIMEWMLIDLHKVALKIKRMNFEQTLYSKCPVRESPNGTKFITCNIEDFRESLIASSYPLDG